jgi:hypothetical protein
LRKKRGFLGDLCTFTSSISATTFALSATLSVIATKSCADDDDDDDDDNNNNNKEI